MTPSRHILIVDDEAALRQTLARILQRAGFDVTTAASGREALALFSSQSFDLIYLDIRMPDRSGLEVLKAIQSQAPELPVILFTAQPDLNSALEALRNGATDYLLKPLKPETIIQRTKLALDKSERARRTREVRAQIEDLQAELQTLDRRKETQPAESRKPVEFDERYLKRGKLTLDLHARRATVGERPVILPPAAFAYLLVLARHSPNAVDYQALVTEAQGYEADAREAQELAKWHVHQIRQAIEPETRRPVFLINVRGVGYRLVPD